MKNDRLWVVEIKDSKTNEWICPSLLIFFDDDFEKAHRIKTKLSKRNPSCKFRVVEYVRKRKSRKCKLCGYRKCRHKDICQPEA